MRLTKVSYPPTMTMISRLEIITTSISASTTSMMMVSFSETICTSDLYPMLEISACSAVWLPKAASSRCTSSTQKWKTYTPCAAIRPMYSGSCSQRLAKIKLGMGRREVRVEGLLEAMGSSLRLSVRGGQSAIVGNNRDTLPMGRGCQHNSVPHGSGLHTHELPVSPRRQIGQHHVRARVPHHHIAKPRVCQLQGAQRALQLQGARHGFKDLVDRVAQRQRGASGQHPRQHGLCHIAHRQVGMQGRMEREGAARS